MPALVLVSAKGSPGVTTAAGALAAVATTTGRALLAELDPSGGSVQVLAGSGATVGLMDAAGQLRREPSPSVIEENLTLLPAGLPTLLAPTAGSVAESVIESVSSRWVPTLRPCADQVVVDAGRWEPSQRTALRVVGADLLVVVCRATVAGVEHSRHLLDRLREVARRPVAVIVVGNRPYPPEQVASYLDVPLGGALAWDPRGTTSLWAHGVTKVWLRSSLARSARDALASLGELVPGSTVSSSSPLGAAPAPAPTSGARPAPMSRPAPSPSPRPQAPAAPAPTAPPAGPPPAAPPPAAPRPAPAPAPVPAHAPPSPRPAHLPPPPMGPPPGPAVPSGPPPAPMAPPPQRAPVHAPPPAPAPAPAPAGVPGPPPGSYPPPPPPPPPGPPPRATHPEVAP